MNPEFLSEGEAVHDFMFAGSHRPRRNRRARRSTCSRRSTEPFPDAPRIRDEHAHGGDDQVRVERAAGDADLLLQRARQPRIGAGRHRYRPTSCAACTLSQYFRGRTSDGLPPITSFLRAGCGFGGSCLPKDVKALICPRPKAGQDDARCSRRSSASTRQQPARVVDLLEKHWTTLRGVRVAVLGLSFKPGTSDVRESPAFPIIRELLAPRRRAEGVRPRGHRGGARGAGRRPGAATATASRRALDGIDAVVVVTPWQQFRDVPALMREREAPPVFVDCRRAFDKRSVSRYEGIGL